jgi:ubiquinone/menaquinone biosynthesis C-methylase UbiE
LYRVSRFFENAKRAKIDHLIKYKSFDAKNIPFDDGSFDAIFSLGTFHHIEEADRPKADTVGRKKTG